MVINWREHIAQCVKRNRIIYSFHATAVEKEYQHKLLIKYFLEQGKSEEEIKTWFKKKDKDFFVWEDDFEEYYLRLAKVMKWPREKKYEVFITKKELDFINSLNSSYDCKAFLMASVIIAKMCEIKTSKRTFNNKNKSYIYYLATGKDEYSKGSHVKPRIDKFINYLTSQNIIRIDSWTSKFTRRVSLMGPVSQEITNSILSGDWIEWSASSGKKFTSLNLDKKIQDFCKKNITSLTSICPVCGKTVQENLKRKTSLCETCYKEKRKKDKKDYNTKIRLKIKEIEQII